VPSARLLATSLMLNVTIHSANVNHAIQLKTRTVPKQRDLVELIVRRKPYPDVMPHLGSASHVPVDKVVYHQMHATKLAPNIHHTQTKLIPATGRYRHQCAKRTPREA